MTCDICGSDDAMMEDIKFLGNATEICRDCSEFQSDCKSYVAKTICILVAVYLVVIFSI